MGATCVAPPEPPAVEKKPVQASQPKPVSSKQPIRDLLVAIFEGHQEFLGWTPD